MFQKYLREYFSPICSTYLMKTKLKK